MTSSLSRSTLELVAKNPAGSAVSWAFDEEVESLAELVAEKFADWVLELELKELGSLVEVVENDPAGSAVELALDEVVSFENAVAWALFRGLVSKL